VLERTEYAFESEHRTVRPDGSIVWLRARAAVIERDDAGAPLQVAGVVEDQTARKDADRAVADSNRRFERALEGSLIAVWEWNLQTGEIHWSRRLYTLLGLDPDTTFEQVADVARFVHPEDAERVIEAQRRHIEEHAPYDLDYRMLHTNGDTVIMHAQGTVERDSAGAPLRFIGSLIDVTAERAAQSAARQAGTRAQHALDAGQMCVWEFDAQTGLVTMDSRLAALIGRPEIAETALSEDDAFAMTAPEDLNLVLSQMARVIHGGLDVVHSEHRIVHASGRRIWILAHVAATQRNGDGVATRLIGITQDLSRQKAEELALREAKEHAEAANAAKSAFLATMSHEIRTPLNGVLGMAQLLTLGVLDDKQRRYAETILASGRSLSAIIDDVLDISRIEAGKMRLEPAPARVSDMVNQAVEGSRANAAAKGLMLHSDISEELSQVRSFDSTRMTQVLANLVSNAVKFTDSGGVRVRAFTPAPGRVRFEVADDGPGVPEALYATLFDRFTQADMSTRRTHEGSGLGLAIARELTELAGGEIGLDGARAHGALFWFEIPAPEVKSGVDRDAAPGADRRDAAGVRVLVIEDHAVNREATLELLAIEGFTTLNASSAAAALTLLRTESVDAVLLDLHMAGCGGDAVLAAIRGGTAGPPDLPVLLVTADASVEARERADALKADGFFAKPINFNAVRRALMDAVAARSA
jgi:PAS domain S-box-containing protein